MFATDMMNQLKDMLPFLIPIVIIEIVLFVLALKHILTHDTYKRGNRTIWLIITIVFMNYVGPILYFVLGKEDS